MEAENVSQATEVVDQSQTQVPEAQPQITDLDGLSEFNFQGTKYTPEQFHKIFTEHKTYAEQVQEYKREKEFSDNLQIDLDNVLADPRLADKFKATYPKKYHAVLDRYLQSNGQAPAQSQPAQTPSLPKEFLNEFNQVKAEVMFQRQRAFESEVATANAQIEKIVPPLLDKYPMAVEDQVYGKAEAIVNSGQKLTEKTWERLVRESHDAMQKRADRVYGEKLNAQLEKGQRGSDIGSGGAVPGQAPKRPRTFDEAREMALESLKSQRQA